MKPPWGAALPLMPSWPGDPLLCIRPSGPRASEGSAIQGRDRALGNHPRRPPLFSVAIPFGVRPARTPASQPSLIVNQSRTQRMQQDHHKDKWSVTSPTGRAQNRALAQTNGLWRHIDRLRVAQKRLKTALATEHDEVKFWQDEFADALQKCTQQFQRLQDSCNRFTDLASAPPHKIEVIDM